MKGQGDIWGGLVILTSVYSNSISGHLQNRRENRSENCCLISFVLSVHYLCQTPSIQGVGNKS